MMGNMGKMMKQVQKMQADMMKVQEELVNKTVEASSGGGMVKVVANGKQEIVSIEINPEAVDPDDVEMLQDMINSGFISMIRQFPNNTGRIERVSGRLCPGQNNGISVVTGQGIYENIAAGKFGNVR